MLFACGSNAQGQLANGTADDSHSFLPCSFCQEMIYETLDIACGANHTVILLRHPATGRTEIWGSGDGKLGQLGIGGGSLVFRPIRLPHYPGYSYRLIAAAWQTTYVLLSCPGKTDILLSMGADEFGNLGIDLSRSREEVVYEIEFGHLFGSSNIYVHALSSGPHHIALALSASQSGGSEKAVVVGWGASRHGQLGRVDSPYISTPKIICDLGDISSIALGNQHTTFLHQSGRVSGFGSNRKKQLLDLDKVSQVRDVCCCWNGTYMLLPDSIHTVGSHSKGQLGRPFAQEPTLGAVQFPFESQTRRPAKIACGSEHVLALMKRTDLEINEVWGWGWNEHGNLGTGATHDVDIPVRIWPPEEEEETKAPQVIRIWAGQGTSWIELESG